MNICAHSVLSVCMWGCWPQTKIISYHVCSDDARILYIPLKQTLARPLSELHSNMQATHGQEASVVQHLRWVCNRAKSSWESHNRTWHRGMWRGKRWKVVPVPTARLMSSVRMTALVYVDPGESVTRLGHGTHRSGDLGRPPTPLPATCRVLTGISIRLLLAGCFCLILCLLFMHLLHKKSLKARRLGQRVPRDEASVLLVRSSGWHF